MGGLEALDTTEVNNKAGIANDGYEDSDYEAVDKIFEPIHEGISDSQETNPDFQGDCGDYVSRNNFLKSLELEESSNYSESDGSSEIL